MKQTTVPMKEDARLIIKTSSDIMIEGIDVPQLVAVVDDGDSFRMKDEGGVIYVRADSDAKLSVPRGASVTIEWAGGDAGLMNLTAKAMVQKVGGDLTLQNLQDVSIDSVGGDCYCKEIAGTLDVHRVGADLDGFKVAAVKALTVGGDIQLSDVTGAVDLNAGGDIHIKFGKAEVDESHLHASGDIHLDVVEGTKALLSMKSYGETIVVNACGQQLEVDQQDSQIPLGEGGNLVELVAQGDISVGEGQESTSEGQTSTSEFSFVFDDLGKNWNNFGHEIEEKIRQSMKTVNHSLKQAGWEASEAMQRATDKMRSKESKIYGFSFDNNSSPAPKPEKKVVSDEERMMVLKMLQDKKISVEEAEKLLQALER